VEAIAVDASPVEAYLAQVHARHAECADGALPTYIPELGRADPSHFGLALATIDGVVYETGESRLPFTVQSMSKPLVYGIALAELGEELVRARVGVEPTGDAFNSISLEPNTGKPLNPMVNAGAIATTGLVVGRLGEQRAREAILDTISRYAGRELTIDQDVHRSERETGFRNVAIANLLRNFDIVDAPPELVADVYFEQCSILLDCRDLAIVAATLAAGGVNPLTGERVLAEEHVRSVLNVMTSCGMYDSAGDWLFSVGLPAKSGVSGGILAVLPGRLGIGAYSPLLDASGNSVRGVAALRDLSRELSLHLVDRREVLVPPIRLNYAIGEVLSKRQRPRAATDVLVASGGRTRVYELQGELAFGAAEQLARDAAQQPSPPTRLLLDLRRVSRIDVSAAPILAELGRTLARGGGFVDMAGIRSEPTFEALLHALVEATSREPTIFGDIDLALEWHEDLILAEEGAADEHRAVQLAENELLRDLDADDMRRIEPLLRPRPFEAGETVIRRGDEAAELMLVTRGRLSVAVDLPGGERRRLASVVAGMMLGELSLVGRGPRTADVVADTAGECYLFDFEALDALGEADPGLKARLLEAILVRVTTLARRLDGELTLARA
jgi:glutaminase